MKQCIAAGIIMAIALKQLQAEKPAYQGGKGAEGWWTEVIKRTALGAGGDLQGIPNVSTNLPSAHLGYCSNTSCKCLPLQNCSTSDVEILLQRRI